MKISELEGAELDYWVARASGMRHETADVVRQVANYSTNWAAIGPIIVREHIQLNFDGHEWSAEPWNEEADMKMMRGPISMYGKTPLIAVMRAFVALKLGAEVLDE